MPCLISRGNVINNASEGITSQKILVAKALTFVASFVSMYSQIIAITETKGIDARIAPIKVLRLAISEIATIRVVVTTIFSR